MYMVLGLFLFMGIINEPSMSPYFSGLTSKINYYNIIWLKGRNYTNGTLLNVTVVSTMIFFLYFVFVLTGWSLLPNALRPFKIYCAPLNLGITRT